MKHLSKIFVMLPIALLGCTQMDEVLEEDVKLTSSSDFLSNPDNEAKAIQLADSFFNELSLSRSGERVPSNVMYILRNQLSRSEDAKSDTLAYIINYAGNNGFAVVANCEKIKMPLAFSESGNLDFANEAVNENFINNIGGFVDSLNLETPDSVIWPPFPPKVLRIIKPKLKVNPHQADPWNRYVDAAYPGWPAGCVPLAITNLMLHSKDRFRYNGKLVEAKGIVDAIHNVNPPVGTIPHTKNNVEGGFIYPDSVNYTAYFSYEQGIDLFAKMVYDIGTDIDVSHYVDRGVKYTGGDGFRAIPIISSCGLTVSTGGYMIHYNQIDLVNYLIDNHVIYIEGNGERGHGWLIDGCRYFEGPSNKITSIWLHCDWGWGGAYNGYYSGDIFYLVKDNENPDNNIKYRPGYYFAVKDESTNNK